MNPKGRKFQGSLGRQTTVLSAYDMAWIHQCDRQHVNSQQQTGHFPAYLPMNDGASVVRT